jgi:glutamine synthetase type III
MTLNTVVAEAIVEINAALKAELTKGGSVDDAALKVVRKIFKDTTAIRFEGNGYSEAWVKEAKKRGLLNLRRAPEALAPQILVDCLVDDRRALVDERLCVVCIKGIQPCSRPLNWHSRRGGKLRHSELWFAR